MPDGEIEQYDPIDLAMRMAKLEGEVDILKTRNLVEIGLLVLMILIVLVK